MVISLTPPLWPGRRPRRSISQQLMVPQQLPVPHPGPRLVQSFPVLRELSTTLSSSPLFGTHRSHVIRMSSSSNHTPAQSQGLELEDIVIVVMGPTGAGKSTLVSSITGVNKEIIGHSLKSFTNEFHAIKFWDEESGRYLVLVDTPGFDDTYRTYPSDFDILTMVSRWLGSSYSRDKLLSGILYLHRITDNRMVGTPLRNLRIFRELCGKNALDKVYLTTTMWDEVAEAIGETTLKEIKEKYWNTMLARGAQTHECKSRGDMTRLIRDIVFKEDERRALQLQQEMGEYKKKLKGTAAGEHLFSELELLVEKQSELLQRIAKERKATSDPKLLADLQGDYIRLRGQIDDKLHQMQVLKSSWFKNIRRLIKSSLAIENLG